jgi:hypothetical protein
MSDLTREAAILTTVFSSGPTTPAPAPSAPPVAPTAPPPFVEPGSQGEVSPGEAATLAAWAKQDLAAGKISSAQAEKIFNELGRTPEQRLPDTRSEEVKALDKQFPPAKEHEYVLRMYPPGQAPDVIPQEVRAFEANARGWMGPDGAGLPLALGNTRVNTIAKVVQQTQHMTEGELETYRQTELAALQQAHGEKLQERLQAADDMIDQLEHQRPGLKHVLGSIGIGKNAMIWNVLMNHAPIYHARRKGR